MRIEDEENIGLKGDFGRCSRAQKSRLEPLVRTYGQDVPCGGIFHDLNRSVRYAGSDIQKENRPLIPNLLS